MRSAPLAFVMLSVGCLGASDCCSEGLRFYAAVIGCTCETPKNRAL